MDDLLKESVVAFCINFVDQFDALFTIYIDFFFSFLSLFTSCYYLSVLKFSDLGVLVAINHCFSKPNTNSAYAK